MESNDIHQEIIQGLKKYRLSNMEPHMEEDDHNEHFRINIFQELGELGYTGITLPETYGGMGLGLTEQCLVLNELAKTSVSYAVTISVSSMVQTLINDWGNEFQKNKFLPELCSGKEIASFCLSESTAGSDASQLKTTAKKVDGGYLINGSKMWISSAGLSKTYLVFARTGQDGAKGISAFLMDKETPGFSVGKKEKKIGWKSSPTREVFFKDCFIPEENLLGELGTGFKIALSGLDKGRITIGAIALGLSERALEESVKYTLKRQQFQSPLFEFQGLQFIMADMSTEIECVRSLIEKAATEFDQGKINSKLAAITKLKATDVAMKISTDAVQVLGGVGITSDYPVERLMRDAKILQIVEGTNQIQKVIIARHLRKEFE